MTIIEALRISDRVRRKGWKGWQVNYGWISFKGDEIVYPVYFTKEDLLATDWQPYEPEKEKCEACKAALASENVSKIEGPYYFLNVFIADHLRKFHCTCGGKK